MECQRQRMIMKMFACDKLCSKQKSQPRQKMHESCIKRQHSGKSLKGDYKKMEGTEVKEKETKYQQNKKGQMVFQSSRKRERLII